MTGATAAHSGQVGALTRDVTVRILNCSASGCLLLASAPLPQGTTASLRLVIDGVEATEIVQVVRCRRIEGAGTYHIGTRFLWTSPPRTNSVRHLLPILAAGRADNGGAWGVRIAQEYRRPEDRL